MRRRLVTVGAGLGVVTAVALALVCNNRLGKAPGTGRSATSSYDPSAAARARKPDPRTAPRATISGVVTSKGGGPIAGAQVCALGERELEWADEVAAPGCTRTDAAGRYELGLLVAGRYHVAASAAHHAPGAWIDDDGDQEVEAILALAPGERRDAIDIVLPTGGVEVRGTVSDVTGGPVAGARVALAGGWFWHTSSKAFAETAADGTFHVWCGPGRVSASATADGYTTGWASGSAPTNQLDIQLTPESVLSGLVVDAATGSPVEAATVTASPFMPGRYTDLDYSGTVVTTDARGRFRITGLAPGRYKPAARDGRRFGVATESVRLGLAETRDDIVVAITPGPVVAGRVVIDAGAAPSTGCAEAHVRLEDNNRGHVAAEADEAGHVRLEPVFPGAYKVTVYCRDHVSAASYPGITVTGADVTGVTWTVTPGTTIRGTITTRGGKPVAGALVSAYGDDGYSAGRSNASGVFTIRGLRGGTYAVKAEANGHAWRGAPTKVTADRDRPVHVDLVLEEAGEITGVVVDAEGAPVPHVDVSVAGLDEGASMTDARGEFAFHDVLPGTYRVGTTAGGGAGTTASATVVANRRATVRLVTSDRIDTIAGIVIDGAGQPIVDAYVTADVDGRGGDTWRADNRAVMTDASGRFELRGLAGRTYTVRAYRRGGSEARAEHVAPGTRSLRITIAATAAVAGTVVHGDGRPADEVIVSVRNVAAGFMRDEWFVGSKGGFVMEDVPPGTMRIVATTGEGTAEATVALAAGERRNGLRLVLPGMVTIRGRLVSLEDGAPLSGFEVSARSDIDYAAKSSNTRSGSDGRFTLEAIRGGPTSLWIAPSPPDARWDGIGLRRSFGGGVIDLGEVAVPRSRYSADSKPGYFGIYWGDATNASDATTVARLVPGAPAERAGLQPGDVITAVDGHDVTGRKYLAAALLTCPAGTRVTVTVARGATITMTSAPRPADY